MKKLVALASILVALSLGYTAKADPSASCGGGTCVSKEDLQKFIQIAKEQQCLKTTQPKIAIDPVTIIVDKEGRVYGSGNGSSPYHVHMSWCDYEVDGTGDVKVEAAEAVVPDYGFRFVPKIMPGLLPFELGRHDSWTQSAEVALLTNIFYYRWVNLGFHVGYRSFGAGLSGDLTKNTSLYIGYANTYGEWRSNMFIGLAFAL